MNESETKINIEFEDGVQLTMIIDRVLAPLIVEEIISRLPFEGKTAFLRGEMKIILGLNKGNVKPTKTVKKGDVAYMPLGDSLCIYAQDMSTFSQVNIIGHLLSDDRDIAEILSKVRRGSQAQFRLAE